MKKRTWLQPWCSGFSNDERQQRTAKDDLKNNNIAFTCPNYIEICTHSFFIKYIKYTPLYKSLHDIKCTWLPLGCSEYSNDESINSSSQGVPYMTKNNCFLMSLHIWNAFHLIHEICAVIIENEKTYLAAAVMLWVLQQRTTTGNSQGWP